jgi:hypothetical protein
VFRTVKKKNKSKIGDKSRKKEMTEKRMKKKKKK